MWRFTKWFTKAWWAYLLAPKADDVQWPRVLWCRAWGHRAPFLTRGIVYYNLWANEPDYTCVGCYDDFY